MVVVDRGASGHCIQPFVIVIPWHDKFCVGEVHVLCRTGVAKAEYGAKEAGDGVLWIETGDRERTIYSTSWSICELTYIICYTT